MTDADEPRRRKDDGELKPPVTAEDVVSTVVEKAAEKVASAVNATSNGHSNMLSRAESWAAIAALIILNIASIWLALANNRLLNNHSQDFKILCQVVVDLTPPDSPGSATIRQLAECFK